MGSGREIIELKVFEFAEENALVNELQPAVLPFDSTDFVVRDGLGAGVLMEREYIVIPA